MELAIFVYVASILPKLEGYLSAITVLGVALAFLCGSGVLVFGSDAPNSVRKIAVLATVTALVAGCLGVLVPKEKTAYMMLGAYVAQKIVESPKTEIVSEKVITLINIRLDELISNSKD